MASGSVEDRQTRGSATLPSRSQHSATGMWVSGLARSRVDPGVRSRYRLTSALSANVPSTPAWGRNPLIGNESTASASRIGPDRCLRACMGKTRTGRNRSLAGQFRNVRARGEAVRCRWGLRGWIPSSLSGRGGQAADGGVARRQHGRDSCSEAAWQQQRLGRLLSIMLSAWTEMLRAMDRKCAQPSNGE